MRARKRFGIPSPGAAPTPPPGASPDASPEQVESASSFTFRAYKSDDVRHALEALFHGKCAYCEARYEISGPVDVEHFRPKKGVMGDSSGHRGYWWLAAAWDNLLPSCLDCNRRRFQPTPESLSSLSGLLDTQKHKGLKAIKTGKETCFPVRGARMTSEPALGDLRAAIVREDALLLDPCSDGDDPGQHIRFHIDREEPLGVVFAAPNGETGTAALPSFSQDVGQIERDARAAGISVRGAVSIQVYGLNRLALVQERTRILRRLEFLGDTVVLLSSIADDLTRLKLHGDDDIRRSRAVERLRAHINRTLAEIGAMAAPEASFSSLVKSWIEVFKVEMRA